MKVILAFDSFKGSLTADQAVHTAAIGVSDASAAAAISKIAICESELRA